MSRPTDRERVGSDVKRVSGALAYVIHEGGVGVLSPAQVEHLELISDHLAEVARAIREGSASVPALVLVPPDRGGR